MESHEIKFERAKTKAWYRILQVIRGLAYLVLIGISWALGAGQPGYTDYFSGVYHPATSFSWHNAFVTFAIGFLVIELIRAVIIYIATGRSVAKTINDVIEI